MDSTLRKVELVNLKNFFKLKRLGYEELEKHLNYSSNTLRSSISRGGNDALLLKMRQLKINLFPEDSKEELAILFPQLPVSVSTESLTNCQELQLKLIQRQDELLLLKDEIKVLREEIENLANRLKSVLIPNALSY